MLRSYFLCIFLCLTHLLQADYRIEGKVNMKGNWQNTIYLATINKLDDYYNANAAHIINSAPIDSDGNFSLSGNNLPNHSQFYRLYLIKETHSEFNACLFEGGEEHNFIHLLLDNKSRISVLSDHTTFAPFGNYQIKGDTPNQLMKQLGTLVYPSYIFYEIRFPSELQFARDKLNRDLFHFADTCSNILVALAALNNTDFDNYFHNYKKQYLSFAQTLKNELPQHPYTEDYFRKMRYYGEESIAPFWSHWSFWTSLFLGGICAFLFIENRKLKQGISRKTSSYDEAAFQLTKQEEKILQLIVQGQSNKEIASTLYVELSTVKSHINKLYSKLSVSKRSEAIQKAKSINNYKSAE